MIGVVLSEEWTMKETNEWLTRTQPKMERNGPRKTESSFWKTYRITFSDLMEACRKKSSKIENKRFR